MPSRAKFRPVSNLDLIRLQEGDIYRNGIRMDSRKRNPFEEYMREIRAKIPKLQSRQILNHHENPDSIVLKPSPYYRQFGIEKEAESYVLQEQELSPFGYTLEEIESD